MTNGSKVLIYLTLLYFLLHYLHEYSKSGHCRLKGMYLKRHEKCCFIRIILQKSLHSKIHRLKSFGLQFNLVKGVCRQFFFCLVFVSQECDFGRLKRSEHPNPNLLYLLQRKYSQYGLIRKHYIGHFSFFFQVETLFLTIQTTRKQKSECLANSHQHVCFLSPCFTLYNIRFSCPIVFAILTQFFVTEKFDAKQR